MKLLNRFRQRFSDKGQGLVETALFLPILIFILAGIVEVGNLLVTQNRLTTSSRISAGFGAANFNAKDWASTADAMGIVALNTVTETLDLDENLWDVWAIRAETNSTGTGFDIFTNTHVYGNNQVVTSGQWSGLVSGIQSDVLAALQEECSPVYDKDNKGVNIPGTEQWPCASDMAAVASVPFYDMNTILGLPVWQWFGLKSVQGLTVMRVGELPPFGGCPILPITIRLQQWSLYPSNWDQPNQDAELPLTKLWGNDYDGYFDSFTMYGPYGNDPVGEVYDPKDGPINIYPLSFDYSNGLTYVMDNPLITTTIQTNNYVGNVPGVPLPLARPGYVYWAREVGAAGQFGWLQWQDIEGNVPGLDESLTFPGNFLDPVVGYPNGNMDRAPFVNYAQLDPPCNTDPWDCGNADQWLDIGEWIPGIDGNKNATAIKGALKEYVDGDIPVFLLIYDYNNFDTHGQTGENLNYHIWDFAKIKIRGWKFTANEKWIVFEFISWGVDCKAPL